MSSYTEGSFGCGIPMDDYEQVWLRLSLPSGERQKDMTGTRQAKHTAFDGKKKHNTNNQPPCPCPPFPCPCPPPCPDPWPCPGRAGEWGCPGASGRAGA